MILSIFLIKNKSGLFSPMDSDDHDESKKLAVGEVVKAKRSRNYEFHKKGMALLNLGHQNQDRYENFDVYRKIITIKAGFYDIAPTKDGTPYYIPKSLSYDKMTAKEFEEWYEATLTVIAKELDTAPEDIKNELNSFY